MKGPVPIMQPGGLSKKAHGLKVVLISGVGIMPRHPAMLHLPTCHPHHREIISPISTSTTSRAVPNGSPCMCSAGTNYETHLCIFYGFCLWFK
jgi:hypothetical protein